MFRMKAGFGDDYCDGVIEGDDSSCNVSVQYKNGCSAYVKSVGVEVEDIVRYLVEVAPAPRVEVKSLSAKEYLGRLMVEMLNVPLEEQKFTTVARDDVYVESVAEEDGLVYTVSFDGSRLLYTYKVEEKVSGEYVEVRFNSGLPLEFDRFIEALNIEEE